MEAAIVINVSKKVHMYLRGPLGRYIVPAANPETDEFGLLVVIAQSEIQDIGNRQARRGDVIEAKKLAKDIVGDAGEKMGMLICSAEPDEPRSLERAVREERDYLNEHPGAVQNRLNPRTKIRELKTERDPDEVKEIIRLSQKVQEERARFHDNCRKLVTQKEVDKAQANLTKWYQDLVQEGNRLWARTQTRSEVNEHHKWAAVELGLDDLPWNNTPVPREDCPGCGEKVKLGIAMCPNCQAILDEDKARKLWPEKFAQKKTA